MLEEDIQTGNDKEEEGMHSRGRAQENRGLPVGDVSPAAVAADLSDYLPHSIDQAQKNRSGPPKKMLQAKDDLEAEAGVLQVKPGTFKTPSSSGEQQCADLDGAFENGSPFEQVPKGISNQEQGFALSSTKKHSDMCTYTLTGEQQVISESRETVATIQDDFPHISGGRCNMVKSNSDTQQGTTDNVYRKPERDTGGGEGRNVVAQMPWMSDLMEQDDVTHENDAGLCPSARLLQNSRKTNCQGQDTERRITVELLAKPKMAESVISETPTWTGELTDRFRETHSEMSQCAGEAVKELVGVIVPHEHKVKHGQEVSLSKKNKHSKTQVRQSVSGGQDFGNDFEENSSSSFDQSKEKLVKYKKKSDKSSESIRMDTAVNKVSHKTDVRLVDSNVCQMQPSVSSSSTGPDPVNHGNEKPKKKMGRPPKKCKNIVTEGTIGILGADCSGSVKEYSELSPQDTSDKKTLETAVCVRKKKRGRGKYIRKPVYIIPPLEQVVGKVIESTAETLSPSKKQESARQVIGGEQVMGTDYKVSTLLDLKATTAPTTVRSLPHEQHKRGRPKKIFCFNEKTSNSFESQNCGASQQVMLPPSKIKTESGVDEMSTTYCNVKAIVKAQTAVVSQHDDGGSTAVGPRIREADGKCKRKIGRPFKKKTLIKMAKQLALAQVRTANATDTHDQNHPENIPFHASKKYKLKRERKKVELYSPVSQLRRYSRACKLNASYSDEKQEHPTSSHKSLLSSVPDVTVPHVDEEKTVSRSSAVLSISKKDSETAKSARLDSVKVTWKKRKHFKNKRKCQENIKVEEIQQPLFTTEVQNSSAFQKILSVCSRETASKSGHSTEKKLLKNQKMKRKATKIDKLRSSKKRHQSLSAQSLNKIHNDIAAAKDTVPLLIPKAEYEETNVSKLNRKYNSHSKVLPPSQSLIESTISGNKGPQRRGRPSKNKAAQIPTVKFREEVKKEIADSESITDLRYPSQECPLKPSDKVMSNLTISANSQMKRPRKVDRRRKRFRHQKAQELKALSEALIKPQEPMGQCSSQIDNREDARCISQTHSNKRKLEPEDQPRNDSDPFAKKPRKAVSSWKRRRRKRSWWDDRGKSKVVLTEKCLDSMLKPSLPSVEGKAEVEVVEKSDFDVKTHHGSITTYQNKIQTSDELPSHAQVVPQRSDTDRISGGLEFSDQTSLSPEEAGAEKSCYQGNSETLKNAYLNETEAMLLPDSSISENQSWEGKNHDGQSLAIRISGPPTESCLVLDELQEEQSGDKTMTSSSHTLKDDVNVLETHSSESDELLKAAMTQQKSGGSRNGDNKQKQIVTNEENDLRVDSAMLADQMETDVEKLESSESKTLNPTNPESSKMLDEEDGLSDVAINQTVSLHQNASIQDLPPDKKGWEKCQDGVEQSDEEFEDEGCNEEEPADSISEGLAISIRSKARGPGRPPKDKGKKPIECQFCGRPFHHISAYIIHRRVHTGERPYSCQECGKTFAQLSNLNTHRKTHKLHGDLFSGQEVLLAHSQTKAPGLNQQSLNQHMGNEGDGGKKQHRSLACLKDGKPQICSVCGKGFRYSSMLKIHMRVHSGEKPYSCKICGKSFSQACSVRVHEKIHWSVKPYICNLCGKGFSQLGTLRTHFYSHTGVYKEGGKHVGNKVTFQCRTCNKSFSIWHQYNFHLKAHADVRFFACDICDRQFKQMSDLSFHRQSCGKQTIEDTMHHTLLSDTLKKSKKQKGPPFQPHPIQHSQVQSKHPHELQSQQFSSNYCISQQQVYHLPEHKSFSELMNPQSQRDSYQQMHYSSRIKHRQMASPAYSQMIIKSPHKRFPSRHALSTSVHLDRKFDPRKYLCPRCGRLFRHLGRLRAHMLTHVRGHSYTCGRCGKMLDNWNKFWLHQRIHRQKQGRFFCPKCGQGFRFAGKYKQHLQNHKELRLFACSSCPQAFSNRETLNAHQRDQHKLHKCNVCGKSFHLQGNLQRHNLVHRHTHPECCPHCSLLFPNIHSLQEHMITHKSPSGPLLDVSAQQNLLPYQCGECEASFKNLDLLFRHQLCHSPSTDRKPWCNGEIVGMQNKSPYVCTPLDVTSVYPSSSSLGPHVSALYTNPSSHRRDKCVDHSQLGSSKPSHPCSLQSLENNTHLPQTPSLSTAVPFSEAQPLSLPKYPQTCTSALAPSHALVQTSPKYEKCIPLKPLRTYEKSRRGVPSAPLSSVKPQSEENSRDNLECTECGAQFNLVPELFEHYLQHARGEL